MALTKEEAAQLEALQKKADEPDEEPKGNGLSRVLNVTVDLGDEAQVERAIRLGFMEAPQEDDEGEDDDSEEESPRRRGYFGDDK